MAKWYNPDVFDNGLNHIITRATTNACEMVVIEAYSAGDDYTTVNGNVVASVAIDETDLTLGSHASGRRIVVATQSLVASGDSVGSPDLHVAIRDTTATEVLAVTDDLSDRQIFTSDPIDVPEYNMNFNQPA